MTIDVAIYVTIYLMIGVMCVLGSGRRGWLADTMLVLFWFVHVVIEWLCDLYSLIERLLPRRRP